MAHFPPLPTFSGVYVFGDSLVDPGNALKAANFLGSLPLVDAPDRAPAPDKGYFAGRFSDGYNFADLISNKLLSAPQKTTFPYGFEDPLLGAPITVGGRPNGVNLSFAYGGAQAIRGDELVPDLDEQTDAYRTWPSADPNALYIVTIGGNDIRALVPRAAEPVTGSAATSQLSAVAGEIAEEVAQLYQFGARHVLVTGLPDVGSIPYYTGAVDEATRRSLATDYSQVLDGLLTSALAGIALPADGKLYGFSLLDFLDQLRSNPSAYGLTNLTEARTVVQQGALAPVGSGFLFFDDVHPSAQTHALGAAAMLAMFGGPPEAPPSPQAAPRIFAAIEAQGGSDTFTTSLLAGQSYTFDVLGVSSGSGSIADPRLTLVGPSGAAAGDDDSGLGLNARLQFVAPEAGSYTLRVAGVGVSAGSYVLQGQDLRGSDVVVEGGVLNDVIGAVAGRNVLRGGAGDDAITGGSAVDEINGNAGNDTVTAGDGPDIARGGGGADRVLGGLGDDRLYGDLGADLVQGNAGADACDGGGGGDTIRGGQGADLLTGGEGADWLAGDAGADTLVGGAGADIYYSAIGTGEDQVRDFNAAEGDRVQLPVGTTYSIAQVAADTVVTLAGGDRLTLLNLQAPSPATGWIFSA